MPSPKSGAPGVAIDATGFPLPPATLELSLKSDAVLLGAVGGPKWDTVEGAKRPERGLLDLCDRKPKLF